MLASPRPNPARAAVAIRFVMPREGRVSLAVYDPKGRLVKRLVEGTHPGGEHLMSWNLRDDRGSAVAGGLYFVRLESDGGAFTRRMTVFR